MKYLKNNIVWLAPIITLIVNIFIVYYGRIYYPNNFNSNGHTPFYENYIMISLIDLTIPPIILMITHVDFFGKIKFNESDFKRIMKERDVEKNRFKNRYFYTPTTSVNITDNMVLETFNNDNEFYKAARGNDMFISRTKDGVVKQINNEPKNIIYTYLHLDVQDKINEIIKNLNNVESFKWIRIYYSNIDDLIAENSNGTINFIRNTRHN